MRDALTALHFNELFVSDCLKYIELGEQLALKISNWKGREAEPEVLNEAIREFSHLIHTLKGISSMVKEGKLLATRLHQLEDELLNPNKNWKKEWDHFAFQMNAVFQFGRELLRGIELTLPNEGKLSVGHWVEIENATETGKFFFTSEEWLGILEVDSIQGSEVCLYQGEWIPVIHLEGNASPEVAFVFQSAEGKAAVLARKYLGKITYDEARRKGAVFSWNPLSDVARRAA